MIRFLDIKKSFGSKVVLDGVNLEIPKGSLTFIIGKSGEGKSVSIKHIMGLLKPDSGKIYFGNDEITQFSEEELRVHRQRFGMLFQHAALFDSMSVFENIAFPLKEYNKGTPEEIRHRVLEVMDQCAVPGLEDKFPSQLSTGEKKRVGLARALAGKPEVILYDEPTTGMDPLICEMIDQLIAKVSKEQADLTSVVISHDLKAAMAIADRIIMLYKGRVILSAPPIGFRQSDHPVIKQFFSGKAEGPMEFF